MCLFKISKLLIAERDITTYKVVFSDLKSQYYNFQYNLDKTYSKIWDKSFIKHCDKKQEVSGNAFHSCLSKENVIYLYGEKVRKTHLLNKEFIDYVGLSESQIVVKCVIPKGSQYYKGTNSEIASDNIIIKEVCH